MLYISRLGLDPELAIVSKKTGKARSAHTFIEKKEQYTFSTSSDSIIGSEADRDGPAIEIRSIVDSACRDNIVPYMAEAMRQQQLGLDGWNNGRFTLSSAPVYTLDETSFKGKVPKDVLEFGCNPDIDAYTLQPKAPVLSLTDRRRYTGGHIHASSFHSMKNNPEEQAATAILFDYVVALPFVAMLGEAYRDGEAERREFYGQPGSYRFDNGLNKIEFRTLSGRLQLHPTLMYWAMGMVRSMFNGMRTQQSVKEFLKENFLPVVDPETVYNVIANHDVEAAVELAPRIFQAYPKYEEREKDLCNPVDGGGGGVYTPYFHHKAWEVFVLGNKEGIAFKDDLAWNWGLYKDYEPTHHRYWGIQVAMNKQCDDDIFPYNAVLDRVFPADALSESFVYTHPTNGGASKWTTRGAPGWLQ